MTVDAATEAEPAYVVSTALEVLLQAGVSGLALVQAIRRIEATKERSLVRVICESTIARQKSEHANEMRSWRKKKRETTFQISSDSAALKPIAASLGPRPHNPLGQKSGHIARRPDVTRTIMGDPEPGRSALDRRKT
jgi:hypothetical protein